MCTYYAYTLNKSLERGRLVSYALPRLFVSQEDLVSFLDTKNISSKNLEKITWFSVDVPNNSFVSTKNAHFILNPGSESKINNIGNCLLLKRKTSTKYLKFH